MFQDRPWLRDFDTLSPDKQVEVIDFIQFLRSRKSQTGEQEAALLTEHEISISTESSKGTFLERAKDLIGIVDDAPADLASNPKHMQGFGE